MMDLRDVSGSAAAGMMVADHAPRAGDPGGPVGEMMMEDIYDRMSDVELFLELCLIHARTKDRDAAIASRAIRLNSDAHRRRIMGPLPHQHLIELRAFVRQHASSPA